MSNFDFLTKNKLFSSFAEASIEAEKSIGLNNVTCAILSRRALEIAVKWLYANDSDLKMPYQNNISALIHDITFKNIIDKKLFDQINYIIKLGNIAVHSTKKIQRAGAVLSLNNLFDFMSWIAYCYDENYEDTEFDESILQQTDNPFLPVKEREDLYEQLSKKDSAILEAQRENEELKKQLRERRSNRNIGYVCKAPYISEQETRERYIDLDLNIAGWEFNKNMEKELELIGMPNQQNVGYADYVLFGENGLPLAIVEAKRTSKSASEGKQQAKLYADSVEKQFGQRPVIYYTNGFEIYMWDDIEYNPRKVSGYYTQEELQLLIDRRKSKGNLNHVSIDLNITNREYQIEAIKMVCEAFAQKHRKALLVMTTGTGKTRVSISLSKVLAENNWAKNILFLADRTVLVKQAKNNFVKLLPDYSCCNLLESKDDPESSRIIFSTYQTMINAIDTAKAKDGNKLFTSGHFDLIIVDEAHRSIYQKYQAIFEYYDALVVGLTATPRNDVDKNTYRFFEIENDVPTFAYEYEDAVKDGFLVDYHTIATSTDFMDRGIKYNDLSPEEKEEYEKLFEEEEELPDEINADAINSWLFNKDTIKKLLELLMTKGLKVEGGDKIGKTIIFARNHNHAELIVKVFNELYPSKPGLIDLIDNRVNYAQSLIDQFSVREKLPQIAVSVDMLDTGVDIPEVVNLVFFKPVKSRIKFWQMIGRGTRLCKDLFGNRIDKKEFYIFDYCKNFEFFEKCPKGIEPPLQTTLTEKIYGLKLDFITEFQNIKYREIPEYVEYREKLIEEFLNAINSLNKNSFIVKAKLEFVEKYSDPKKWISINLIEVSEIKQNVIPLFQTNDIDEFAKRFDNLVYKLQIGKILNIPVERQANSISELMGDLEKLGSIPQIYEKREMIAQAKNKEFLKHSMFFEMEKIREEIRGLIQFLDSDSKSPLYTDFDDTIQDVVEGKDHISTGYSFINYKRKLQQYLNDHMENIIIYKIRHNQKLTTFEKNDLERILFEELGNEQEYQKNFEDKNIIETIRNIVGLDKETADQIFNKYINDNKLNMKQIEFVKRIKEYVVVNGTLEMQALTEQPFTMIGSVAEVFEDNITIFRNIKQEIEKINKNARETA